jgi:hypothetical protein
VTRTRKRDAWVVTWEATHSAQWDSVPRTSPGVPLALFPVRTNWKTIEAVVLAFYQAHLACDDGEQQYRYMGKPEPHHYTPQWDLAYTNVDIGHDPTFIGMKVTGLQLVTQSGSEPRYVWDVWAAPQRHIIFRGGPFDGNTAVIEAAFPQIVKEQDGERFVYTNRSAAQVTATAADPWEYTLG